MSGLQEFDMNYLFLDRIFMDVQVSAFSSDMDSCEKMHDFTSSITSSIHKKNIYIKIISFELGLQQV
jgi:hypothetical protein